MPAPSSRKKSHGGRRKASAGRAAGAPRVVIVKKPASQVEGVSGNKVRCQSYTLQIQNGPSRGGGPSFSVNFFVNEDYWLQIKAKGSNQALMTKVLSTLNRPWPTRDFTVTVDAQNQIIDIEP